jgi:hypothetical protein
MYVVVCSSGRTRDNQMYAHVFNADIRGETTERTLTDST